MKPIYESKLVGALIGTLCLGTFIFEGFSLNPVTVVFSSFYLLAFVIQLALNGQLALAERESAEDRLLEGEERKAQEAFYYCGSWLEKERTDELAILSGALSKDRVLRRILACVGLLSLYLLSLKWIPGFEFRISEMIYLISVMAIVLAFSIGHFLIPLGMSCFSVLIAFFSQDRWDGPSSARLALWGLLYLLGVFCTLVIYRLHSREIVFSEGDKPSWAEKRRDVVQSALSCAALFMAIYLSLARLMPDPRDLPEQIPSESLSQIAGTALSSAATSRAAKLRLAQSSDFQENIFELNRRVGKWRASRALPPETLLKQTEIPESTEGAAGVSRTGGVTGVTSSEDSAGVASQDLQRALKQAQVLAQEQAQTSAQAQSQVQAQAHAQAQALALKEGQKDKPHISDEKPWIPEEKLRRVLMALEKMGIGIVLAFAIAYLSKFFRKKVRPEELDQKRAAYLEKELRRTLRDEWKALCRSKLDASQEVIAKYHFFLKLMDAVGHARPESVPPTEYALSIYRSLPWIGAPARSVTDVFCDVYYGKDLPEDQTLRQFRGDLGKICSQFI